MNLNIICKISIYNLYRIGEGEKKENMCNISFFHDEILPSGILKHISIYHAELCIEYYRFLKNHQFQMALSINYLLRFNILVVHYGL